MSTPEAARDPHGTPPPPPNNPAGPVPSAPPEQKSKPTTYVVLQQSPEEEETDGTKTLEVVGEYSGRTAKAAINAHIDKQGLDAGTFYAVPKRSWERVTVRTETMKRTVFE